MPSRDLAELARRLPKADLHCHLIGTVRPHTLLDLARKHGITLPAEPAQVYPNIDSSPPPGEQYLDTVIPLPVDVTPRSTPGYSLLKVSEWVADVLRNRDDFARIGFEAAEDAFRSSNTRHLELHVEVGWYLARGVDYATVVDGLDDGLAAAAAQYGTTSLLIAGIDRSKSASVAEAVVETVAANPRPRVVGVGLDNLETAGPPERFAGAYAIAERAGLRRTAHCGEHVPNARNVASCLNVLHCDRLDHGYFVLEDPALVARCRDQGVPFTCICTTSRRTWRPWRRESIRRMVAEGLSVVLASDDPAMFPTTLADEYAIAAEALDADAHTLAAFALRGIDACWLDADAKRLLRHDFDAQLEALLADLDPESPTENSPTRRMTR